MEPLRLLVEHDLTSIWDGRVVLEPDDESAPSGRAHVHRFRVRSGPTHSPPAVVVKQPRLTDGEEYDAGSPAPAVRRFFNEWACLQLLTEISSEPPSPRFYCGNARHGFLVMEDLGAGDRLDQILSGPDPARGAQTVIALFETVGQMHAATMGQRSRYEAIVAQFQRTAAQHEGSAQAWQAALRRVFDALTLRPHAAFLDEMAELGRRLESPAVEALVHGDVCPDNCQWAGSRVRLLDFEHGGFGSPSRNTAAATTSI